MPAGLLLGASGAASGLEELLARRFRDAQLAEQMRHTGVQEDFQQQQLRETGQMRRAAQRETERMHREAEADRQAAADDRRLNIRLASLQPGSVMGQEERDYLVNAGLSPSSFEDYSDPAARHPLGPHAPGGSAGVYGPPDSAFEGPDEKPAPGPAMFRFQGKTADRLSQERIASSEETAALNRQNALSMAQLAAATRLQAASMQGGQGKVMNFTTPDGRNVQALVSGDGRVIFAGDSQLPAGMKGKQSDLQSAIDQIRQVRAMGDQSGWKGVGTLNSPVGGFMKRNFGYGDDTADQLRASIDSLKADIAHEKYGAAFTATERGMLQSFAAGSNMDPSAIKNRLDVMERVLNTRLQEMASGRSPSPINLSQGGIAGQIQPPRGADAMMRSTPGGGATSRYKVTVHAQ